MPVVHSEAGFGFVRFCCPKASPVSSIFPLEIMPGVMRPVAWSCEQPLNSNGSITAQLAKGGLVDNLPGCAIPFHRTDLPMPYFRFRFFPLLCYLAVTLNFAFKCPSIYRGVALVSRVLAFLLLFNRYVRPVGHRHNLGIRA
jgi:hypothetical protein